MIKYIQKKINSTSTNQKLILFSLVLSFYYTLTGSIGEVNCYSTAHSYFYKYNYFLNNIENIKLSPEILTSLDSFSFSRLIISFFNLFSKNPCYSIFFIRYVAHLLPLLSILILINFIYPSLGEKKKFIIGTLTILLSKIFLYIPIYELKKFNYPFLLDQINNTIHLNGLITIAFSVLLFPALFFFKQPFIKSSLLLLGGLINPLITTGFYVSFALADMKYKQRINLSKILLSFIPFSSYFVLKEFINRISGFRISQNDLPIFFIDNSPYDYLDFINLVDFHRNEFNGFFYNLFNKIFNITPTIEEIFDPVNKPLIISISYLGYIATCSMILIAINIYSIYPKRVRKFIYQLNSVKSFKRFIFLINPLLISLTLCLILDFLQLIYFRPNYLNFLNILVIYNQIFFSRFISLGLVMIYFILGFFININIVFILYTYLRKINIQFFKNQ